MNLAFYYRKKCRNIYDYINILLVNQFAYGFHARTLTHAYSLICRYCRHTAYCCWSVLLLLVVATTLAAAGEAAEAEGATPLFSLAG